MKSTLTLLVFILFQLVGIIALNGQSGCTDPRAINYDENATANDGSCVYPTTNYRAVFKTFLSNDLQECSGMSFDSSGLWALNDSGNSNELMKINATDGTVLRSINLANTTNVDWEDIAESDDYLYIGDFGNNGGNRKDLKIYRIPKSEINSNSINADTIVFRYVDQNRFDHDAYDHNFDCEGFIYDQDSLRLFSKNWNNGKTKYYVIPAEPGNYIAELRDSFNVQGLITAADISENGLITLLQYNQLGLDYLWLLWDYPGSNYFSGNKRRLDIGSFLENAQAEGIVFKDAYSGYIGAETFQNVQARLLEFDVSSYAVAVSTTNDLSVKRFNVYPNPAEDFVRVEAPFPISNLSEVYLQNNWGGRENIQWSTDANSANNSIEINTSQLIPGLYFLIIYIENDSYVIQIMKSN